MQYLSDRLLATKTRGQPGKGPEQHQDVAAGQRNRLLTATEQLLAERGCAGTTIERIAKRARVSSVTFYDHFAAKEDAFVATFERAVGEVAARLGEEVPAELPWPERVREGLRSLLAQVAASPERARVCLVEAPKGGTGMLDAYDAAQDRVVALLREGRRLDSADDRLPAALEETTAAGLAWLLRERLEARGAEGVEQMLPALVDVALRSYLDPAEVLRIAGAEEGA
jgi:AcrR family transcriptional regulator